MCPITEEATSKTHPPYDSLQTVVPACVCAACVLMPVQELATGPRGMAGTAALPPRQGGAGRTDGSRRKSERREGAANKVELEGQTGRGGNQTEGRYSLAGLEFRDRRDCMTPKVRFLDGVVCVLLCVGLNPCRLHVVLLRRATCRICKGRLMSPMKVVYQ
jgi:hypothetical protein